MPCAIQATERSVSEVSADAVDLLFVIDDSISMDSFQATLRRQFPRLVRGMLTGDHDDDPNTPSYPRVTSLRVGVVTTDMGELGVTTYPDDIAPFGCYGPNVQAERIHYGTDGVMVRTSRGQDTPTNHTGLQCDFDGDGDPDSVDAAGLPAYLTFDAVAAPPTDAEASAFVDRVSCFGLVGIGGCGSEMPFESMLKSLTPSTSSIRFHTAPGESRDRGHGDDSATNANWLRPNSLLAIVMLTDEDDCSSGDRRVYDWGAAAPWNDPANVAPGDRNSPYVRYPFQRGTRCLRFADRLQPIARYVDGLLALRSNPERVVFAAITGVPQDMVDDVESGEGATNLQAILDDDRVQYELVPDEYGNPLSDVRTVCEPCDPRDSECTTDEPIKATPARRVVELAESLRARGANAIVQSICEPSYAGAIEHILSTVGTAIAPTCLALELERDEKGYVGCTVTQVLPSGERCEDNTGHGLLPRRLRVDAQGRDVCAMVQLPVFAPPVVPMGTGWYLDDFTPDAARCGSPARRLTFVGDAGLRADADTHVECVTRRTSDSDRVDVGTACDFHTASSCGLDTVSENDFVRRYGLLGLSRPEGLGTLACEPATRTCQLPCIDDSDCPMGTTCVDPDGASGHHYFPRCVAASCRE